MPYIWSVFEVGVSNTAGTLNFTNDMKTIAYIVLILIAVICAHIFIKSTVRLAVTSSPVEEMYHKQLVITLDSVLDARGIVKDTIDNDEITVPHDSLGRVLMSNWYYKMLNLMICFGCIAILLYSLMELSYSYFNGLKCNFEMPNSFKFMCT